MYEESRNKNPENPGNAQPRRRRTQLATATGYSDVEMRVAVVLRNTYDMERVRYLNQTTDLAGSAPDSKWKKDFQGMGTERRKRVTENIEDNPDDSQTAKMGRYGALWLKLAKTVLSHRIDPEAFIRTQFYVVDSGSGRAPLPESFMTPTAFTRYEQGRRTIKLEIQAALNAQTGVFRGEVSRYFQLQISRTSEEAWADVLSSTDTQLTPLFRYCVARGLVTDTRAKDHKKFADIAEMFKLAAAIQYIYAANAYDAVWGSILPDDFKLGAESMYANYCRRPGKDGDFGGEFSSQEVQP